jgi:transposase
VEFILSDGKFELLVVNARHLKNVPGRKTDMDDAVWMADLVGFGLIKASFVPEQEMQELRSLLRARKQLTREQTRHVQRIQKTLEEANIKLDWVISAIMGLSGRRMIEATISGVRNPWKLAELADRRIKASRKESYDALHGRSVFWSRFYCIISCGGRRCRSSSRTSGSRRILIKSRAPSPPAKPSALAGALGRK